MNEEVRMFWDIVDERTLWQQCFPADDPGLWLEGSTADVQTQPPCLLVDVVSCA